MDAVQRAQAEAALVTGVKRVRFTRPTVRLTHPDQLRSIAYRVDLAKNVYLLGISRRELPNWQAETLYRFNGLVFRTDGTILKFSDTLIDDVYGDDGSFRWTSTLLRYREIPPKRSANKSLLPRLEVWDACFKVIRKL